jgi:hypothetical protein
MQKAAFGRRVGRQEGRKDGWQEGKSAWHIYARTLSAYIALYNLRISTNGRCAVYGVPCLPYISVPRSAATIRLPVRQP